MMDEQPRITRVLIWWLCQDDYEAIGDASETWPEYLRDQYGGRKGRPGRGRLWVDNGIAARYGTVSVAPWPETPIAQLLSLRYGGVVIDAADAPLLDDLPGYLTDQALRRCLR